MSAIKRGSALGLLALCLAANAVLGAEPPVVGLGWLRDLAGDCWRGEQADGTPADTQCYDLQLGRHLHGTIEIPARRASHRSCGAIPCGAGIPQNTRSGW